MYDIVRAAALAAAALIASSTGAFAQAAASPARWSASDCQTCHDNTVTVAFGRTAHATLAQQCESCHAGAGAHLASQMKGEQGGPAPSIKTLDQKARDNICLSCHETEARSNWAGGMHDRRGTGCTTCHSVHDFRSAAGLLRTAREADTCYTCHKDLRAKSMRASHHPVREGKVTCSSCHNPHNSPQPKMIAAASVNDKCYECHAEKRGPFLWEHAPVRENCLTCHDPHGSNHPRLVSAKQPYLCQRCHGNSDHPGALYDANNGIGGPIVPPATFGGVTQTSVSTRTLGRSCLNCHSQIHGSNSASGVLYGR